MCRKGQAREQQRLRMRHDVPDVKMTVYTNTNLSHARKIHVCGSVTCAWVWCGVHRYLPVAYQGNTITCNAKHRAIGIKKKKSSLFVPTRCLPPFV